MLLAFDTCYHEPLARTACVAFEHWTDAAPVQTFEEISTVTEPYAPGAFYRRELPCILSLLRQMPFGVPAAIITDGYVLLDDEGTHGLGGHLYAALDGKVPIIGVAKSAFARIRTRRREVLRPSSQNPLYVTALGIELDHAAELVRDMYGPYRLPDLLRLADSLSRKPF